MTLLLSRNDVVRLLTMKDAIAAVEEAFCQLARGNVTMPQRTAIRVSAHGGTHLGMPAYIGGDVDALALKVVTVYPQNPAQHHLPTTIGLLVLSDPRTGAPLAVMDASYLTAMRTGAVSGVATKHLARADARRVGIFGAGVQAQTQLSAIACVRDLDGAWVYDSDTQKAKSYAEQMTTTLSLPVTAVATPRDAVEGMDVIVAASSASEPIFDGSWLEPGQHINGVGSHAPHTRELDTTTISRSKVFVDSIDACLVEAGDLLIPMTEGAIEKGHIRAGIGEVAAGMKPGRESDTEITLFKSVGLALQDASTAHLVYQMALKQRAGVEYAF
jgi:ornithine cyclodeaminase/alanine dehydrogenase